MRAGDVVRDDGQGGVLVAVHAQPGASRAGPAGRHGDALRLRVGAPADRGRANAALAALLAQLLDVRPGAVELVRGTTGREKQFRVVGITVEAARARLAPHLDPPVGEPSPDRDPG